MKKLSRIGGAVSIFALGHYALEPLGVPHGSAEIALESMAASALIFRNQITFKVGSWRSQLKSLLNRSQG